MARVLSGLLLLLGGVLGGCDKRAREDVQPMRTESVTASPAPTNDRPVPSASASPSWRWPELHELGETAPSWRDTPVGSVRVGVVTVKDGRVGNAEAVVAIISAAFRRCYNKAL